MWSPQPEGIPPPGVDSNPPRIQQVLTEKLPPLLPSPIPANTWAPLPDRSPLFKTKNMREMHSWLFENITFKCKYVSAALTENGHEHGQQQQRMCGKHRNSCHADGQRQQQTPEGTLHTYNRTRGQHFRHFYLSPVLEKEKTNTASLWHLLHLSLAYDFHEDLLPVLTRLEASLQRRGLRESCELLLDEVLPLQEIGIRLKWGFSLVCGLTREEEEERERERIKALRQLWNRRRFVAWRWRDLQIRRPWTASGPSLHAFPPLHGTAALGAGWVQGESGTRDEEEAEWKIACCLWGTADFLACVLSNQKA